MREIILYTFESDRCPVEEFLDSLTDKQFEKVAFVLDLIEQIDVVPKEYFKKLRGTDDIWEVRVQHGNMIFRLLGFWDGDNLVILNHAFRDSESIKYPSAGNKKSRRDGVSQNYATTTFSIRSMGYFLAKDCGMR